MYRDSRVVVTTTMVMAVAVVLLVVVMGPSVGEAAPSLQGGGSGMRGMAAFRRSLYGAGTQRRVDNHCTGNAKRQYLCEMCAKETKSLQVYTLCCNGADDAQNWCQSFLVYGITGA